MSDTIIEADKALQADEALQADKARQGDEALQADKALQADEAQQGEEARLAEEDRLAEEARQGEEARLAEEDRLAEEAGLAEDEDWTQYYMKMFKTKEIYAHSMKTRAYARGHLKKCKEPISDAEMLLKKLIEEGGDEYLTREELAVLLNILENLLKRNEKEGEDPYDYHQFFDDCVVPEKQEPVIEESEPKKGQDNE